MKTILSGGWREYKRLRLRKKNVKIGARTLFNNLTYFEGYNYIKKDCHLYGARVGIGSYMGDDCIFNYTSIGRFCSLGAGIRVSIGDHPIHKLVSIHPAFYSAKKQAGFTFCDENVWISDKQRNGGMYACNIGNDVWIGDEVTIIGGVSIADGTVIGAGAVVTKDTDPYGIYVGVPAKKIGTRFTEEEISFLLKTRWWESDMEDLSKKSVLFSDIHKFVQKYEG